MVRWLAAVVGVTLATVVAPPGPVRAAPSDCYSIRDQSERQACIAYQSGEPAMCVGVQGSDARTLCRIRAEERRKEMGR